LIAGLGIYIKRVAPHVKIIKVQNSDNDVNEMPGLVPYKGLHRSDGDRKMRHVSGEVIRVCTEVIDEIVQVDMDKVCLASTRRCELG
jgi:threonine dehydratase